MNSKAQENTEQTELLSLKGLLKRTIEKLTPESVISWLGLSFRSKNRAYFR